MGHRQLTHNEWAQLVMILAGTRIEPQKFHKGPRGMKFWTSLALMTLLFLGALWIVDSVVDDFLAPNDDQGKASSVHSNDDFQDQQDQVVKTGRRDSTRRAKLLQKWSQMEPGTQPATEEPTTEEDFSDLNQDEDSEWVFD